MYFDISHVLFALNYAVIVSSGLCSDAMLYSPLLYTAVCFQFGTSKMINQYGHPLNTPHVYVVKLTAV
jgi:hypothetical protein